MKDFLFILVMAAGFSFLYFVMARLDAFWAKKPQLEHNPEYDMKEPTFIILPESEDDTETMEEIHAYRKLHNDCTIVLYNGNHEAAEAEEKKEDMPLLHAFGD